MWSIIFHLLWAPCHISRFERYSINIRSTDGRRPVFLVVLPLLSIGSFGTALATNIPQLMVWRFAQAWVASPGISVGAGVVGDIYKSEERGTAMGIFFGVSRVDWVVMLMTQMRSSSCRWTNISASNPRWLNFLHSWVRAHCFDLGFAAHYTSWRIMQEVFTLMGVVIFLSILFFFPETSHPGTRGIDKLQPTSTEAKPRSLIFINPFKSLFLLRSPNLLAVVGNCLSPRLSSV
jgi:MFS family permease